MSSKAIITDDKDNKKSPSKQEDWLTKELKKINSGIDLFSAIGIYINSSLW